MRRPPLAGESHSVIAWIKIIQSRWRLSGSFRVGRNHERIGRPDFIVGTRGLTCECDRTDHAGERNNSRVRGVVLGHLQLKFNFFMMCERDRDRIFADFKIAEGGRRGTGWQVSDRNGRASWLGGYHERSASIGKPAGGLIARFFLGLFSRILCEREFLAGFQFVFLAILGFLARFLFREAGTLCFCFGPFLGFLFI